jgi:dUTP pyrophosphatase
MEKTDRTQEVSIRISLCRENAKLPFYANPGDAGMDIVAASEVTLLPGQTMRIPTGIKVAIPVGYEIQVRPRSGLSLNTPLRIPNAPGTIDSGYRDEVQVILSNTSTITSGNETFYTVSSKGNFQGVYKIMPGDRIAQLILQKVPTVRWDVVDNVEDVGNNRGGGFGSSGEKTK